MKELWLNFKDEKGEAKRVLVEGEKFAIGRTPDNDLQIPLGSLSRQHAKIERFADVFVVSDCGSSNGSMLNNEPLENPVALKNGDKLNLGDSLEIEIEIPSDKADKDEKESAGGVSPAPNFDDDEDDNEVSIADSSASSAASTKSASASTSSGGGSGSLWLLMLAPILMVLVLLGLGGTILLVRSAGGSDIGKSDNTFVTPTKDDFPEDDDNKKTPDKETPTPTASPISNSGGTSTPGNSTPGNSSSTPATNPTEEITPTQKKTEDAKKIEDASAKFLRRIAKNDPNIYLLDKQIVVTTSHINHFKGSGTLAENIKNAKKNASQIKALADSKNLKPQFLAVAALAKLGNQKGDVLAAAGEMLEKLSDITKAFGNDTADDSLLIIAAYSSNTSGERLQNIVGGFPNSKANPRAIRSIWFFKENGKLSNAEFDFALQFLAIGTITQNPKDFNVSAEALVF